MPEHTIRLGQLKKRILQQRGVELQRHTRKPILKEEVPSMFVKTPAMRLIEMKFNILIEKDIYIGSLNEVEKRYQYTVERSTISKWRKYFNSAILKSKGVNYDQPAHKR